MATWTKFGKAPARPGAIQLEFSVALPRTALPTPPVRIGQPWIVPEWGMLGNDQVGNCVLAGAAHETMYFLGLAGEPEARFDAASAIAAYSELTGYDPSKPSTDNGTDVQAAAAWRLKTGIADADGMRHRIDAYANLTVGDAQELALAVDLFGAAGVGLQLPTTAVDQFDRFEEWDDNQGSEIAGLHYVPCVGRNSKGRFLLVSWGRLQAATEAFLARYMDEGVAYLSFEAVRTVSPALEANMRAELAAVTGRPA